MSRGLDIQSHAIQPQISWFGYPLKPQIQAASEPQFEVFDQSEFVIYQLPK